MSPDARERLPILRGRIDIAEPFQSPRGGPRPRPAIPERDPRRHQQLIMAQLEDIFRTVGRRAMDDRDLAAARELVVLRPAPGFEISAESFGDKRQDVRVISVDEATGGVLIDARRPDLPHLRKKIERYADDSKVNPTSGTRRGEPAVAPLQEVRLAKLEDLAGSRLRQALATTDEQPSLGFDELRWFELSCRGGRRERTSITDESRMQVRRRLVRLGRPVPQEFLAAERLVLFARLSVNDLRALVAATDCLYEVDLAGPPVRDWLLLSNQASPARDLQAFRLAAPPVDAPSVVSLDTGVAARHPMLAAAVLSTASVVPGEPSPEDAHGHGTWQAGVALHNDVGTLVEQNEGTASHWLQSVKVLRRDGDGSAADENRTFWPLVTQDAVRVAEEEAATEGARRRVFAMAVTAPHDAPPAATLWSNALGQLAYNDGRGRLFCISIGNSDVNDPSLAQSYPTLHLDQLLEDPAQAANVLTVGAYTLQDKLPPDPDYGDLTCLAPAGGVSPWTRAGVPKSAIKPDVVFEGGNAAFDEYRGWRDVETLCTITTGKDWTRSPLAVHAMTSCATAHAARFAAQIWVARPDLRPETVRALIVHSARWTPQMLAQFANVEQRLALCGYGVPDLDLATACLRERATVIVEDTLPNAVEAPVDGLDGQVRRERRIKFFRLPVPEEALLAPSQEGDVELRVTLSYFAEPSTIRRRERHGLDLAFEVQGADETEEQFRQRMNKLLRPARARAAAEESANVESASGDEFRGSAPPEETDGGQGGASRARAAQGSAGGWRDKWEIGIQRRARGTVQSDFIAIPAPLLAGAKLIAVFPVLGWWDERRDTEMEQQPFALVVTVTAPGRDVYTPIELALSAEVEVEVPGA